MSEKKYVHDFIIFRCVECGYERMLRLGGDGNYHSAHTQVDVKRDIYCRDSTCSNKMEYVGFGK